jgi:hypothetical protein
MICLRSVLFGMVESNLAVQSRIRNLPRISKEDITAWNDTTKTVLESVSKLTSMYLDKVEDTSRLGDAWSDLLDYLQRYFKCASHALGSAVFSTITRVFSRIEDPQVIGSSSLLKTANIWKQYFDNREAWNLSGEDNQDAFIAYAESFKVIYRLAEAQLSPQDLVQMLSKLEACVVDSDEVPYSSDVDNMTPLQARILDCFAVVRSQGLAEFLIETLGRFAVLPYPVGNSSPTKRGPTFVALSKAAMTLLQIVVVKHVSDETVYTDGALLSAMISLVKPLRFKYVWKQEGKSPAIWQKATTTALAIIEANLPEVNRLEDEPLEQIWEQVVNIAHGITYAHTSDHAPHMALAKDEAFDIESFIKLKDLITLPLGSSSLSDALRRTYTRNVFKTSIIHEPSPGEVVDLENSPLEGLYKVRLGRTDDSTQSVRPAMAYVCLSELFSLVSWRDSSAKQVKLAQAAAPYFILRAALPLRMYIADHALRGRMPQPESQRCELLFVLEELGRLKSEPAAIPDAPGVRSKHRKHLHRLYPLLVKATRVARNDQEVFEALIALTDLVGAEFGVSDE